MDHMIRVDTESMENGGVEISRTATRLRGFITNGIGFSVNLAAVDPPSCEGDRVTKGKMIAACVPIDLRRAAEFSKPTDEGFIQLTTLVQVFEQCARRLIQRRQHVVLQAVEIVPVGIEMVAGRPIEIARGAVNGRQRNTGVRKAPSQEDALPANVIAVGIAQALRLLVEIEGCPNFRAQQHPHRVFPGSIEGVGVSRGPDRGGLVDLIEQRSSGRGARPIHSRRETEIDVSGRWRDSSVKFTAGRTQNDRIVALAEKPGVLPIGFASIGHGIGKR